MWSFPEEVTSSFRMSILVTPTPRSAAGLAPSRSGLQAFTFLFSCSKSCPSWSSAIHTFPVFDIILLVFRTSLTFQQLLFKYVLWVKHTVRCWDVSVKKTDKNSCVCGRKQNIRKMWNMIEGCNVHLQHFLRISIPTEKHHWDEWNS